MTSKRDFLDAWKVSFPSADAPNLDCFHGPNSENSVVNLDKIREEKRKYEVKTEQLRNQLRQHEFVVTFLAEILQKALEGDFSDRKKEKNFKAGPPIAPKQSSIRRTNPDISLDCEVPATDDPATKVPAYLETNLDFVVERDYDCDSQHEHYPSVKTSVNVHDPKASDHTNMSASDVHEKVNEEEPANFWTKGLKWKTSSQKSQEQAVHVGNHRGNTASVDSGESIEMAKKKLIRNKSADSNKPTTAAKPRRETYESEMSTHSFDGYLAVDVNAVSKNTQNSTENKSFSTFKPKTVTETASDSVISYATKKPKPVPVKRVSLGMPDSNAKSFSDPTSIAGVGVESNIGVDKIVAGCDFSEDKIPPGMCRIMPPSSDQQKSATLPTSIQSSSQPMTSELSWKQKRDKFLQPVKPPVIKSDHVKNCADMETPFLKQERSQSLGPPIMTVKPKPSRSPKMIRSASDTSTNQCIVNQPSLVGQEAANLEKTESLSESPEGEVIYEEPIPVQLDKVEETSSSDEDEPIYQNLMLLQQQSLSHRQSSATSGMFASMEFQKRHLQKRAERLSRRFSSLDANTSGTLSKMTGKETLHNIGEDDTTDAEPGASRMPSHGGSDTVVWQKRRSMMFATADDNTSEDDLDVMVPTCAETEKIQMRKYVVTSIVESERMYLVILDTLMQYMQTFKNVLNTPQSVITAEDIDVIFYKIPELHRIHFDFIKNLESKLEFWTGEEQIAEYFKTLALEECPLATEYLKNYQKAVSTIHKCTNENPQFARLTQNMHCKGSKETSTLEELLHKPVVRFQRNTLVLHDLIKFTPTCHPDYDTLQKTKKIAQNFLENFESPVDRANAENQRYLSKQGLVVERVGSGSQRKLRQIFLFNDLFVCAKQKLSRQKITYEVKWAIPLSRLEIADDRLIAQEEKVLLENTKQETEKLQKRVSDLQNELKQELRKAKQAVDGQRSWSFRGHKNNLEKIKKKLYEQESQLMLAAPHLILKLKDKRSDRSYTLLLASDYERIGWKETITGLQSKNIVQRGVSLVELTNLVNSLKLPKLTPSGSVDISDFELEDEALFGSLDVTVHKIYGLKAPADVYCCMEVDTFGHFSLKAKTTTVFGSVEPVWNDNFDIELDGAQQLRVLAYKTGNGADVLIGKCALELCKGWLRGDFTEETISLGDSMTLVLTLKYRSREQTIKRTPSAAQGGLFGVKIRTITEREGTKIPIIVTTCVKEVESRGMDDVGIYRISGLSGEIQKLKRGFERCKSSGTAAMLVRDADINVVTGLLKLYFRELPESLFTDHLYYRFQEGMMLSDPEAKEKFMMTIFKSLPEPNYSTAVFMLDHLVRVSQHQAKNKMSMHNICTVFGPTLLRPAFKESEPLSMEQLFTAGAQDAMMQTGILYFYLSNWHNRDLTQQNTRIPGSE